VFDRKLRVQLSEAFERIEVAVKGGLAYHGSVLKEPFWMSDPANFDLGSHDKIMKIIKDADSDVIAPVIPI
jgi:abortive infection bacteriophage resistance protein